MQLKCHNRNPCWRITILVLFQSIILVQTFNRFNLQHIYETYKTKIQTPQCVWNILGLLLGPVYIKSPGAI